VNAAENLAVLPLGTHTERARIKGSIERLIAMLGVTGAMGEVDRAKKEVLRERRDQAEAEGWIV
jgi:hypothetical protein